MLRPSLIALAVVVLAGCGSSPEHASAPANLRPPSFADAQSRTVAAKTAAFTQVTSVTVNGRKVIAYTNGVVSFAGRRAHVYKIVPGADVPSEEIVAGPIVYSNENAQAALQDPTVTAWTKLDTRKLTARQRATHPDDLAYAIAPVYLSTGVRKASVVTSTPTRALYTGIVDTAALALPVVGRAALLTTIRSDYPAGSFRARFSLDRRGRVRRVRVDYRTSKGTPIAIDTRYTAFGVKLDTTPPATDIKDITPR